MLHCPKSCPRSLEGLLAHPEIGRYHWFSNTSSIALVELVAPAFNTELLSMFTGQTDTSSFISASLARTARALKVACFFPFLMVTSNAKWLLLSDFGMIDSGKTAVKLSHGPSGLSPIQKPLSALLMLSFQLWQFV